MSQGILLRCWSWFRRFGVRPEILHFWPALEWCCCCCCWVSLHFQQRSLEILHWPSGYAPPNWLGDLGILWPCRGHATHLFGPILGAGTQRFPSWMTLSSHSRPTWPSFLKHPPKVILCHPDAHLQALSLSQGVHGRHRRNWCEAWDIHIHRLGVQQPICQALQVILLHTQAENYCCRWSQPEANTSCLEILQSNERSQPGPMSMSFLSLQQCCEAASCLFSP